MLELTKMTVDPIDSVTSSPRFPLIAVLGCTGAVGTEVMRGLAKRDCAVRGVLRRPDRRYPALHQDEPARVGYVSVDHGSVAGLRRAFAGADALFLLVGTHPEQVQTESTAVEAARQAGVRRVIKLSAPVVAEPANVEVANWHREIEAKLDASGLEHCCLRPYSFMQNWLRNAYEIGRSGMVVGSAGSAPRNYVDCRDVASVAVRLLLGDIPLPNGGITLTGPEAVTNEDMAARLSLVTCAEVGYKNLSRAEHYQMLLTQAKLPAWLARHVVELEELAVRIPERPTGEMQKVLGRYPRTVDEFLQEHRAAFIR